MHFDSRRDSAKKIKKVGKISRISSYVFVGTLGRFFPFFGPAHLLVPFFSTIPRVQLLRAPFHHSRTRKEEEGAKSRFVDCLG